MEAEMNKNGIAALVTPRRSARKSIKPIQDYQDIVSGTRHLRSTSKALFSHEGNTEAPMDETRTKWTPAKVGRSSEKRGRKSRRTVENKNKQAIISSSENEDAEGGENKIPRTNIAVFFEDENVKKNDSDEDEMQPLQFSDNESDVFSPPKPEKMPKIVLTNEEEAQTTILSTSNCEVFPGSRSSIKENKIQEVLISSSQDEESKFIDILDSEDKENQICEAEAQQPDEKEIPEEKNKTGAHDSTFNTSDCIIVSAGSCELQEEEMQPIQVSDTECDEPSSSNGKTECDEPPSSNGKTLHLAISNVQRIVISPVSSKNSTPHRLLKSSSRLPTPYKPKGNITYTEDDIEYEADDDELPPTISMATTNEIALRSIRKTAKSITIGEVKNRETTKSKNVTFHSPANQTKIYDQFDKMVHDAEKKKNVTERRRRSKSLDETNYLKEPIKPQKSVSVGSTPKKVRSTSQEIPPMRNKLPNFAAIHKRQFESMENIVDHVNRKMERAKELTCSAHKGSERKVLPKKPQDANSIGGAKSKAVKKINLDKSEQQLVAVTPKKPVNNEFEADQKSEINLPNPRVGLFKPIMATVNKDVKKGEKSPFKPAQLRQPPSRPAFNLSTSVQSHNVNCKKPTAVCAPMQTASASSVLEGKFETRRQQHLAMYKGRNAGARNGGDKGIIKGVRSNRRFELQMQHRRNMDTN